MITFILGIVLSKFLMIAGPALLVALGLYLAIRRLDHFAWPILMAAGIWIASGVIFQQGVAACEARTERLVEQQTRDIENLKSEMTAKLREADAKNARAADDLLTLAVKLATAPAAPIGTRCHNSKADADAINGR